ncbi:Alpha/Beta hydrolase protein [Pestalotiopsis sp. NC0098]|nr:Alpha/Beta hydrolase protein [Pestalotiopsis sp. NC0098]
MLVKLSTFIGGVAGFSIPLNSFERQTPLSYTPTSGTSFNITEQHSDICDAGSRQWNGWIHVSPEKSLFYWFFESRSNPTTDPVVLWINGGPGASSMTGLFTEMGPCLTSADTTENNGTYRNEHSWSNFANLLFIDQPAGVGFSSINESTHGGPDTVEEAAEDFNEFLKTFFEDAFPRFSDNPFHIVGESFGGTYVPAFAQHITSLQKMGAPGVFKISIQSITLVDAVVDYMGSGPLGEYDHMCRVDENGKNKLELGFNETTCRTIELAVPECQRLNNFCIETYDLNICESAFVFCWKLIDLIEDGNRVMYDDRILCKGEYPLCGVDGNFTEYMNRPHFQRALGLENWSFTSFNWDLNDRWALSKNLYMPTTREMIWILDETPIRVLVINGNNDIIVNTEGQKRVYDALPWNHQAKYRAQDFGDWEWPDKHGKVTKGGQMKTADKLAFVSVDEAGHMAPGYQKEAVAFLMACWLLGRESEACPV